MTLPLAEHVRAEIRAEIARQGLTQSEVARRIGTYPQWLNRRLNGDDPYELSVADVEAIAAALGVDVDKLMDRVA
jgi:transcriptional regulator with XRE-family HTH domain